MVIPPLSPTNQQVQPPPNAAEIWQQVPLRQRIQLCAQLAQLLGRAQAPGRAPHQSSPTAASKGEVRHE
jgi:hypothetical protein